MLHYVLFGLLFMVVGEFLVNVIFKETLTGFFGTLILYAVMLTLAYPVTRLGKKLFKMSGYFLTSMIILFGSLGLFVMEWVIIGNSPWGNPDASQIAMFIWWAGVFVFPLLWDEALPVLQLLRRRSLQYHAVYMGTLAVMMLLIPFIPMMKPLALFVFTYGLFPYGYFLATSVWLVRKSPSE